MADNEKTLRKVKNLRDDANMTRDELCGKFYELGVEMTPRMLADRENNVSKWTGTEVVALTKIFNIEAKELNI